ncbi:MAG TPA: spermidine/putrescine ABC transporter substrate-binding protein [Candidatus Limnocylindrales bacterium]|nr:spermidine/putrescine ABC transporter substrate-binding protein [Candidatus Limnocylindrales bacterium]
MKRSTVLAVSLVLALVSGGSTSFVVAAETGDAAKPDTAADKQAAPAADKDAAAVEPAKAAAPAKLPEGAGKELNLFAWSEYVPQSVIDGFTAETGIQVNYETYASNEEMLAKLISGAQRYDLIQPSEYTIEALVKENQLMPVDWSKVPNIKNIGKEFKNLPHDPQQKYTVPWMAGSVGISINTEKVKDPVKGYKDVFQKKYDGRIVILDDPREIVSWALETLGHGPNDVSDETLAAVKPVLQTWLPLVKVYDSDSPKTALLNGDVDLGVIWSGEAALLYKENKKFEYVLPAEGAHQFLDSLAIPVSAANPIGAMAFMNYILRPEVSKLISADFPYTNPNLEARKLLTPEELANPASYPKGNPKLAGFRDIGDRAAAIDKLITDLKAEG